MIEIQKVSKVISNSVILEGVSLSIRQGSLVGLVGPNGAGKTSLIKCLTGLWTVDSGSIKVLDKEILDNKKIKQYISYVSDECNYYDNFKVNDMIKLYNMAYKDFDINKYNEINSILKIDSKKQIKNLSKGMKKRLSVMLAISTNPMIIVLDEPLAGLDPIAKREIMNLLIDDNADRNTTIIISSHNLDDLEKICDVIAIMNNGKLTYYGSLDDMKYNIKKLQVVFDHEESVHLSDISEIIDIQRMGRVCNVVVKNAAEDFEDRLKDKGAKYIDYVDLSLEEMFLYIYGGDKDVKKESVI